jgi:hypothetical protein
MKKGDREIGRGGDGKTKKHISHRDHRGEKGGNDGIQEKWNTGK